MRGRVDAALGLAAWDNPLLAATLANMAAGVVVGKVGTAVAREADLLAAISPQGGALRKVMSREEAAEQVERWRRRGWRRTTARMATSCRLMIFAKAPTPGRVKTRLVPALGEQAAAQLRSAGAGRPSVVKQ